MTEEFAGYWEDFELGKTYPTTTRKITEQDHAEFCRVVGYDVPIFIDEDYAKSTALGGRICPSHLIMSFATAMTGRLFSGTVIGLVGTSAYICTKKGKEVDLPAQTGMLVRLDSPLSVPSGLVRMAAAETQAPAVTDATATSTSADAPMYGGN